jgi:hypothetical protein
MGSNSPMSGSRMTISFSNLGRSDSGLVVAYRSGEFSTIKVPGTVC